MSVIEIIAFLHRPPLRFTHTCINTNHKVKINYKTYRTAIWGTGGRAFFFSFSFFPESGKLLKIMRVDIWV